MEAALWDAAHGIAETLETLSRDLARHGAAATPAVDRTELRARVRDELLAARARFSGSMPEGEAYRALFPLVAHVDEIMQLADGAGPRPAWAPLQKELFGVTNAGDLFFESLDELLEASATPRFALELYLFCLQLGFQGRHAGSPGQLERYRRRIAARICGPLPAREPAPEPARPEPPPGRRAALLPYAAAALLLVASYLGLVAISRDAAPAAPAVHDRLPSGER